jgi:hypothetical protein
MDIYKIFDRVQDGAKFTINLQKRTLRLDGNLVEIDNPAEYVQEDVNGLFLLDLREIYDQYKHSVPSERSDSHRRTYFRALREKDLSDHDMMYGRPRELARFALEAFILCGLLSKKLWWLDNWGTWFYQDEFEKDLILLREWIEPSEKGGKQ